MKNILCIHLPNWPITRLQRLRRKQRRDAGPPHNQASQDKLPLLVLQTVANRQLIVSCSAEAQAAGIKLGMTLAQARALQANVEYETYRPDLDAKALEALARYMIRFTPTVAMETRDIAGVEEEEERAKAEVYLDLTGCEHLFGGLQKMVRGIAEALFRFGIPATLAVSGTPGAAYALTQKAPPKEQKNTTGIRTIIPNAASAFSVAPLRGLRLNEEVLEALHHLGFNTIGELQQLPRSALPSRFGDAILKRLDQLTGHIPEPLIPLTWRSTLEARFTFDGSVSDPQALEQVYQEQLAKILLQLERRGEGIRELEVSFELAEKQQVAERRNKFAIAVSKPSRDARSLLMLYRCAFDQLVQEAAKQSNAPKRRGRKYSLNFDAGYTAMRLLVVKSQHLPHQQLQVNESESSRRQQAWQGTLDLIKTKLGEQAIEQAECEESYLPEKAYRMVPAGETDPKDVSPMQITGSRPLHLMPPVELQVMGAPTHDAAGPPINFRMEGQPVHVQHVSGPERIASQWWEGHNKTRDYFDVADDAGRRYWIFRVQETGKWYMHGVFE